MKNLVIIATVYDFKKQKYDNKYKKYTVFI